MVQSVENDPSFKGDNRLDSLSSMHCKVEVSLLLVTAVFYQPKLQGKTLATQARSLEREVFVV